MGGAVTFNVAAGTYNEYITINSVSGSSKTNTVTFKGSGQYSTYLSSTTAPVNLGAVSYITFTQMSITNSNAVGINMNGSNNCSFTYCTITGSSSAFSTNYLVELSGCSNCTVDHCHIVGGWVGIGALGSTASTTTTITNCAIVGFYEYGIAFNISYNVGTSYDSISNNRIDSCLSSASECLDYIQGIGSTISDNFFIAATTQPFEIQSPNYSSSAKPFQFYNNFAANWTSGYGRFDFVSGASNITISQNTFYNTVSSNGPAVAFFNYQPSIFTCVNNIFYCVNSTYLYGACAYYVGTFNSGTIIDGNDYYNGNSASIVQFNGGYTTLSSYQSAVSSYKYTSGSSQVSFDHNATNILPVLVNVTETLTNPIDDIHFLRNNTLPKGISSSILTDYYGVTRSASAPTAGASEDYGRMHGIYTIGASGSNYTSFAAAISDLQSIGVDGAVIFKVAAGTYYETISMSSSVTGVSASNTITFVGAGRENTILSGSGNAVSLSNMSYIGISGMTLTTSGYFVVNTSYTSFCSVSNCDITSTYGQNGGYCFYDNYSNNLHLTNNHISGAYYGVSLNSGYSPSYSNNVFTKNHIVNFGYYALSANNCTNNTYDGNVIDSSVNGNGYGFYSWFETGATYKNNKVVAALSYPIQSYYPNYYSGSVTWSLINNVMTNYLYEAQIYGYSQESNFLIAHNTFYASTGNDYAFYFYFYYASNVNIFDNLFENNSQNYPPAMIFINYYGSGGLGSSLSALDGNNYVNLYSGGPIAQINNGQYKDIKSLKNDMANYSYINAYTSATCTFENSATSLLTKFRKPPYNFQVVGNVTRGVYAGVNYDISGIARNQTQPTSGAYEFTAGNDAGVTALVAPLKGCPGSTLPIVVTASNLGVNALNSVNVGWSFDGTVQTPISVTNSIPVSGNTNVTLGSQYFSPGQHTLKAWTYSPNGVKDTTPDDDTLLVTLTQYMGGTYTIDPNGSGPSNYATFAAAIADLYTYGVCEPVIFNVAAGTFNENVNIGAVPGASATNTISFVGQGRYNTTLSAYNPNTYALYFNSASYITFSNMTIQSLNNQYSNIVYMNTSKFCAVTYSNIIMNAGQYANNVNIYSSSNCTLDNDYISGGEYALTINCYYGTSSSTVGNITISNNRITNFIYNAVVSYGNDQYSGINNYYGHNVIDSAYNGSAYTGFSSAYESNATYEDNIVIARMYNAFEINFFKIFFFKII